MTLQRGTTVDGWNQKTPDRTPRLRLKPKAPNATGYVDGAWWPHSDDLAAELPNLLAVLSVRLGPIDWVSYNITEWAAPPKKLSTGRKTVRLAGYYRQPRNTIELLGSSHKRIVLLVVPPQAGESDAHAAMMAAAKRADATTTARLLAAAAQL